MDALHPELRASLSTAIEQSGRVDGAVVAKKHSRFARRAAGVIGHDDRSVRFHDGHSAPFSCPIWACE